jgi:enamine deaminase RidA (YjgF/YER057c/UK114 family)
VLSRRRPEAARNRGPSNKEDRRMSRDCVMADAAPKSAWYSQAVKGAGLVFVSGQAGIDPRCRACGCQSL